MLTKHDIWSFLEGMEIASDSVVTMHTSLRSIGEIEGRADGLLDALTAYLHDGLLLIPTHTWRIVNRNNPYYDVRSTVPNIGALPTVAAFRPDAVRTLHPTHSLAVFGKRAEEYAAGEELSASPTPANGALSRLYEENGKILLVGVGHERNTYFHAVDERFNVPNRLSNDPYTITIIDRAGRELKSPPFHGHANRSWLYFKNYTPALEYVGAVRYGNLGNAPVICCDARRATDVIGRMWSRADRDLCADDTPIDEKYYK